MASNDQEVRLSSTKRYEAHETGPFILRSLIEDLPLSADGDQDGIEINCVEFLGISQILLLSLNPVS